MPINEATIAKAYLYPELLPDARVVQVLAGSEVSPPVLELRRFKPKILHLAQLSAEQSANVNMRIRSDDLRYDVTADSLLDQTPSGWEMTSTEYLFMNFFGIGGAANYRTYFSMWVYEATVAHKLKYGIKLDEEEEKIARDLGIRASVEKGVLPLSINRMLDAEYAGQLIDEVVYGRTVAAVTTTETAIESVVPRVNEFLVVTKFSAAPAAFADGVTIRIDRDDNVNYLEFPTFPLAATRDVNCFIPALSELRIKILSTLPVVNHVVRFTVRRYRLTNLLRVRFGLLNKSEAPGDLWAKVKGGVL